MSIMRSRLVSRQGGLLGHGLAGELLKTEQTLVNTGAIQKSETTVKTATPTTVKTAPLITAASNNVTTKTGSVSATQSLTSTVSDIPSRWPPVSETFLAKMRASTTMALRTTLQMWQRNYDTASTPVERSTCQGYITAISRELDRRAQAAAVAASVLTTQQKPATSSNTSFAMIAAPSQYQKIAPDVALNTPELAKKVSVIQPTTSIPILTPKPIPIPSIQNIPLTSPNANVVPRLPANVLPENIVKEGSDPNVNAEPAPAEEDLLMEPPPVLIDPGTSTEPPPAEFPWLLVLLGAVGLYLVAK